MSLLPGPLVDRLLIWIGDETLSRVHMFDIFSRSKQKLSCKRRKIRPGVQTAFKVGDLLDFELMNYY